jgi:ATP-dependent Clp endopeptidase proteolytic subunit ClpP
MYTYKSQRSPHANGDEYDEEIIITKPSKGQSQVNGNDIYFYSDVSLGTVFGLNKTISDLEKQMLITQISLGLSKPPHINLYINSDGGEIFSAFTTVDRIKACKVPIRTYVEGIAASAATLISVCGTKRYIGKTGVMLVHQLRSWCGGTHENFKDEAKNLEMLSEKIQSIYLEHTKFSKADLEELLKHDIYLSSDECLKYGLVDEVL